MSSILKQLNLVVAWRRKQTVSKNRNDLLFYTLAGVLSFALSLQPFSAAHATSAFDNTLVTTSTLRYNDADENIIDISTNWRTKMHAACGATIYSDFVQSLNGGAWAVLQDPTDDDYGVTVIWSKSDQTIPDSSFQDLTFTKILAVDPGWQGKARFHYNSSSDVDVCDYSTVAVDNQYGSALTWESWTSPHGLYMSTYDVNYPSEYAGATVPYGSTVPPLYGRVDCTWGTTVISSVLVSPTSGVGGQALLVDDYGGKEYAYYPSEPSTFKLFVTCDGELAETPVFGTSQNYSWVCDHDDDLGYVCIDLM